MKPTGTSPENLNKLSTALYNEIDVRNANDDCGTSFKFMNSWYVLREYPKFMMEVEQCSEKVNVQRVVVVIDDGSSNDPVTDEIVGEESTELSEQKRSKRPIGQRKAKDDAKQDEMACKNIRLAEEEIKAQTVRNGILKEHMEMMTFENYPTGCSQEDAVEYFNIFCKHALRRIQEYEGHNDEESP